MIFENRRYFTRQLFELKKSTLAIDIQTPFDRTEYEIALEHIDSKKKVQVIFNHGLMVCGLILFAIGFLLAYAPNEEAAFIFFLVSAVCFIAACFRKKRVVTINAYDGSKIELFFNKRNKDLVVAFADELIGAANQYLLRKYGKIDTALPIEPQINHIQFLWDREVITEEEYEALKNQLLGRTKKATVGFGH